jgi:hypothetical protein
MSFDGEDDVDDLGDTLVGEGAVLSFTAIFFIVGCFLAVRGGAS